MPVNVYQIPQRTQPINIDARWLKQPWSEISALQINQFSGEIPHHFPKVTAKLTYDDQALYVIFHVEDQYVRATTQNYQDDVFWDSCVEFFFTPGMDLTQGYFNLEVNCGGTVLFRHQKGRRVEEKQVSTENFQQMQIAHTLPKIVDPEIVEPVQWSLEYRLPFEVLGDYTQVNLPKSNTIWRGNFYKCADGSSHPHWLCWSPIDTPAPDFHRPEYFGKLVFL